MRYTIKQFIYKKMSVKDVHSQLCSVSSKAKSADGTLYYLGFKIWMPIVIIL
jgi:capsule polysaccharide export protein KpsC/LpsZ